MIYDDVSISVWPNSLMPYMTNVQITLTLEQIKSGTMKKLTEDSCSSHCSTTGANTPVGPSKETLSCLLQAHEDLP